MGCTVFVIFFFFFKQKTAYDMRISDWSSDVCSSDLQDPLIQPSIFVIAGLFRADRRCARHHDDLIAGGELHHFARREERPRRLRARDHQVTEPRSEEHKSELQSLMRISYAVFCLKKKNTRPHSRNTDSTIHYKTQ